MGEFLYRVIDREGHAVAGVIEAVNAEYARRNLQKTFRHILEISPRPNLRGSARGIGTKALLIYTQQLSAMIYAGVPMTRAIEILTNGDNPKMNAVLEQMLRGVLAGRTLSSTMSDYPQVFPRIYTSLVATAEASGRLHVVLNKLTVMLEREAALNRRLVTTFSYPITLIILATGVCSLIVFYIFPVLKPMFGQVGMELPAITLTMIAIADAFRHPFTWFCILMLIGGVYYLFRLLQRGGSDLPGGARYFMDTLLLHTPILGRLIGQSAGSRILFSMALMLESGLQLREILRLLDGIVENAHIRYGLRQASQSLSEGIMFCEALRKHEVFFEGALQMLRAGEESGKLDEMMRAVAVTYEQDLEITLDTLGASLEPLILTAMGVVIGFICVASLMPVLKFVQQI